MDIVLIADKAAVHIAKPPAFRFDRLAMYNIFLAWAMVQQFNEVALQMDVRNCSFVAVCDQRMRDWSHGVLSSTKVAGRELVDALNLENFLC